MYHLLLAVQSASKRTAYRRSDSLRPRTVTGLIEKIARQQKEQELAKKHFEAKQLLLNYDMQAESIGSRKMLLQVLRREN